MVALEKKLFELVSISAGSSFEQTSKFLCTQCYITNFKDMGHLVPWEGNF